MDNPQDLHFKELEKEIIESRNLAIQTEHKNLKLKKELFNLENDLEKTKADLTYYLADIETFKTEIYNIQTICNDLAKELSAAQLEIKRLYSLKKPTISSVLKNYVKGIKK